MDREIVAARLSKPRECLRHLRRIAVSPLEDYLSSEIDRALAEHFLRLALEVMLDVGNHLVVSRGFRKPLQLRDIPSILAENGILPGDLARRLADATGLRNRLVHVYSDVDHTIIYRVLQSDLDDLDAFAARIANLAKTEAKTEGDCS